MFLHAEQVTRFNTGFAVMQYTQCSSCPNAPAFHGLKKLAIFLATHVHSCIMYPRGKPKGYQTDKLEVEPGKFIEHKLTSKPCECVDSDHAQAIRTRKSVTCVKLF